MRAARETMRRRFHSGVGKDCVAILDRLRFVCDRDPIPALRTLPGFSAGLSRFPRRRDRESFQAYAQLRWFHHERSQMQFYVESAPQKCWLAPYSVTLIADDQTGLLPPEVVAIVEAMPDARLTMVELALDFSVGTNVTRRFVRRSTLFGKSQRDLSRTTPTTDWWGPRGAPKSVKSYFKIAVCGHRVEFVCRSLFLKHRGIRDIFDLHKLAGLLPERHIFFARVSDERLIDRLRGNGYRPPGAMRVARRFSKLGGDLSQALRYLRREAGLKNVRRVLIPLPENQLVRDALQRWAVQWRMQGGR